MIRLCRWCSAQLDAGAVDWCCVLCECTYYLDRGASFEARTIARANRIEWTVIEQQQRVTQWWCVECGSVPVTHRGDSCGKHAMAAGNAEAPTQ